MKQMKFSHVTEMMMVLIMPPQNQTNPNPQAKQPPAMIQPSLPCWSPGRLVPEL